MNDRWTMIENVYHSMSKTLDAYIPCSSQWSVAEFGIGRWGFGQFYAKRFKKVYGIDIEDYAAYHPGVEFILSDARRISMPDGSVHLTVSHSVLEHVSDLDTALSEINRITKRAGYVFLTVNPLYYSSFGAHLYQDGKRLENWEHLDPKCAHYMCRNPLPNDVRRGHDLNMLTSSMFLGAVGRVPWKILHYDIFFENKDIPLSIDRPVPELDLLLKGFRFVGQRVR